MYIEALYAEASDFLVPCTYALVVKGYFVGVEGKAGVEAYFIVEEAGLPRDIDDGEFEVLCCEVVISRDI